MEVDDYMLLHPIIGFISVSMTWARAMLLQREWDVDPGRLHVDKLWDQMMLWRDRGETFFYILIPVANTIILFTNILFLSCFIIRR